ncbi:serine protease [Sphingorhabdus sp.]|jgi:hypothetical protein|uniref:serine protease n=1 Tax=Sphingorhabdus sp. TaxID=1902408 RepID=UPI0037C893CC
MEERFTRFDWYSLAAVPIKMYFNETSLATGTAFFWSHDDKDYLVTAWHCLSGRHFQTKIHLSKECSEPNLLEVYWNLEGQPVGRKGTTKVSLTDTKGAPLWLVDHDRGSDIDIAILPITPPSNVELHHINKLGSSHIPLSIGCDLFILGFPLGIEGVHLPIWKRGSLASEWQIPKEVQPYWLIDTASRSGMSGAPVIQRTYLPDPYDEFMEHAGMKQPSIPNFMDYGNNGRSSFLGLYSGRIVGEQEKDLQLGMVWNQIYIENILRHQIRDDRSAWKAKR